MCSVLQRTSSFPASAHSACVCTAIGVTELGFSFWSNSLSKAKSGISDKVLCVTKGWDRGFHVPQSPARPLQHNVLQATIEPGKVSSCDGEEDFNIPPIGCTRIKVELNKPLGIVLEEDNVGNIFIAEVIQDGNADKSGLIDIGDQLIATSAIVYGTEEYYQGVKVRRGMQIVRLSVFGERFELVMAAIGTHPAHVKVTLEIQKCRTALARGEKNGAATSE